MTHESSGPVRATKRSRWLNPLLSVLVAVTALSILFSSPAAAVAVMVPYSSTPVADADLDGNPGTGAWGDAVSAAVPLENGEPAPYGTATMYAKHDGTSAYFRIDGSVDTPWTSATGNHFWLGMAVSTGTGGHHGAGTWDSVYFGLWDGTAYTPQPTYPPAAVDTNGFTRPPPKDAVQNYVGTMRYSGTAAPYSFTAEWKRALNTGDAQDISFTANGATTYYFYLTTDSNGRGSGGGAIDHSAMTNSNTLRFASPPANTPPTADLTTPDGGQVWSGGSAHLVRWNMTDAETPSASLRVWINYSADGGTSYSPIPPAQGISGLSNPCTFSWTLPLVDTVQGRVRVTVMDGSGATASDASLADFAIDSTAPSVTAFTPADGTTGVSPATQVRATFSEPMNQASATNAFSLIRTDNGQYIPGTVGWAGNDLVFTPSASLPQGFVFRAQVNASALDASDPGNPLGIVRSSNFTTADVTAPAIAAVSAVPDPQEVGLAVNISAAVTDNGIVAGVWIEVHDPGGASLGNVSAAFDGGSGRYFRDQPYVRPGAYTFGVSAVDAATNWAVASGGFTMVDTQPPVIQHTPVTQALRNTPVRISAIVTDADAVAGVRLDYVDVGGAGYNVSMPVNGSAYEYDIPGQPLLGTLTYFIWATDPTGNVARTPAYQVAIVGSDLQPPVIASLMATPPIQDSGLAVNLTAVVTDNVALQLVSVAVRNPLGALVGNFTMARVGATDTFYFERTYPVLGNHTATVWAVDTSNNNASARGGFEIVDRIPPSFLRVTVTPPVQETALAVNITAEVTDNVAVAGVRARIYDPAGGIEFDGSMAGSGATYWTDRPYDPIGLHSFVLTATDAAGNPAALPGNFTIVDTQPPVAVAGPDRLVGRGALVTFNGSGSHDNVAIANYTWTFADAGPVTLYGATASHGFGAVGSYLVTLTVRDASGNAGADTLWVNVTADAAPPVARPGPGQTVPQGFLVTLDGSLSSDDTGIANYTWTLVDGQPVVLWGPAVEHRFLFLGNFTVTLTVVDLVGNSASNATWVDVVPDTVPPVARAGPDRTINLGESVLLDGSASTDDVMITNYTWRAGASGVVLYGSRAMFTPAAGGTWRVVLTVKDASNLEASDDVNVTVLVSDTTPPAAPLGIAAEAAGPGEILVTWTANAEPDLAGYLLSRSDAEAGPFILLNAAPLANVTYLDSGLVPGQRYWYVVRAVDTAGNPSASSGLANAVAGLSPPEPFDWASVRWAAVPISAGAVMAILGILAWRHGRREEEPSPPPAEPVPPPPLA